MKQNIDAQIKKLLNDHTWKAPAIGGVIALALLILLDSALFAVALALLKLLLTLAVLGLFIYSAYLAYPLLVKKYKDAQK